MAEKFRTIIVGSGPAGLSAAAHAAASGMSHLLLEKTDHLSNTIFRYQRGKHVMATPSQLVVITHQKRTMEIADALYGVTRRGDGVSNVVSQRIRDLQRV